MQSTNTLPFQLEPLGDRYQVLRDMLHKGPTMVQTFTLLYAKKDCSIARVHFNDPSWFACPAGITPREILLMAEGPLGNLLVTLWADNGGLGSLLAIGTTPERTVRVTESFRWHTHRPTDALIIELFHHAFNGGLHQLP